MDFDDALPWLVVAGIGLGLAVRTLLRAPWSATPEVKAAQVAIVVGLSAWGLSRVTRALWWADVDASVFRGSDGRIVLWTLAAVGACFVARAIRALWRSGDHTTMRARVALLGMLVGMGGAAGAAVILAPAIVAWWHADEFPVGEVYELRQDAALFLRRGRFERARDGELSWDAYAYYPNAAIEVVTLHPGSRIGVVAPADGGARIGALRAEAGSHPDKIPEGLAGWMLAADLRKAVRRPERVTWSQVRPLGVPDGRGADTRPRRPTGRSTSRSPRSASGPSRR